MERSYSKKPTVLLLVDDDLDEAAATSALLLATEDELFSITTARALSEALGRLRDGGVDVIVLDLELPDCQGVDSIRRLRERCDDAPIVVLTTADDDGFGRECIAAGAQDYLVKRGLKAFELRRAIGYAILRVRERHVSELIDTVDQLRPLSSESSGTVVTAALAGSGATASRHPEAFERLATRYFELLDGHVASSNDPQQSYDRRQKMERIVTTFGDLNGGPRDLVDLHLAALEKACEGNQTAQGVGLTEARLLALEMMGLLVDYYRVGHRRRFAPDGAKA